MHVLARLLLEFGNILSLLINAYKWIVIIATLITWVNPDPYNPIVRFLRQITEPVFRRVRRLLPSAFFRSGLDLTPLIVVILLILLNILVTTLLSESAGLLLTR